MNIIQVKTELLLPYSQNTKKHNQTQIKNVMQSIQEFGFVQPIVIDENNEIVIGHCRFEAAKKLGMNEVPCLRLSELSKEQIRKLRIADNKTNESLWDYDMLMQELSEIDFDGFEFDFDFEKEDNKKDVSDGELPTEEEVSQERVHRGDIWELGSNRLMCGSSTDKDDVETLMHGEHCKLLFTSPPYSDMREYNGDKDLSVGNIASFITNYKEHCDIQAVNLGIQFKNGSVFPYWNEYIDVASSSGLKLLSWNVWDKLACGSISCRQPLVPLRHEWIFVFGENKIPIKETWIKKSQYIGKEKKHSIRNKDGTKREIDERTSNRFYKKMESVLEIPDDTFYFGSVTKCTPEKHKENSNGHPAPFPVALPSEYIVAFTDELDVVIEPFCGSGTTLMACEQLNRVCYGMELDEHYCDIILKRWEKFTGGTAHKIN